MSWLIKYSEIIGTVAGFVCVLLTVLQKPHNWPLGIVKDAFFALVLASSQLYISAGLQLVFIFVGCYGWWKWLYGGENGAQLRVSRLTAKQAVWCVAGWIAGVLALPVIFKAAAQQAGLPPPDYVYWDASIVSSILIAQWMLTNKKIENWFVWFFLVNLSQVFLYIIKGLYPMLLLQFAYMTLAVLGYLAWRKDLAEPPGFSKTPSESYV
jgi:nicotinamide mononucleotide transporter